MSDGGGGGPSSGALMFAEVPAAPPNARKGAGDDDFAALNKALRACRSCRLVKGHHQFYEHGCDNCTFLNMAEDHQKINLCTTTNFQGIIAIMDPKSSWAARWHHLTKGMPGTYAVQITEPMPERLKDILRSRGR